MLPSQQIDRGAAAPLHYQLREQLRRRIRAGEWGPSEPLPSEPALCAEFGVSRSVVRQALGDLVREGVLWRRRGIGTFIAPAKVTEGFAGRELGFHEDMVARGYAVTSRVIARDREPATPRVAADLGLAPEELVLHISRVRSIDGIPCVFVESWLPADRFAPLLQFEMTDVSLYRLLEQEFGVRSARSRRVLGATVADATLARLLTVPIGDPLITIDSVSYSESDATPFECYSAYHRADRTHFELVASRESDLRELPLPALSEAVPGGG